MKPVLVALLCSTVASAATLQVGPGKTYARPCQAIAAASAGDVIEVDAAGSYNGDTCNWTTDNLTVRGVNGRAKIDATGTAVTGGKGIFVISAAHATLEHFELSGAKVVDLNGAGIRHQGLDLTVRDCFFHDNEDGILGSPSTADMGTVRIESSEFFHNGAGDGYSHNMYLNHYASFTLVGSYSHGAIKGHLVKSRAQQSFIAWNRLTDEAGEAVSYEVDLPNAGRAYVIGNLIEQSATAENSGLITFGLEGATNAEQRLFLINNTVVNDRTNGGSLLAVGSGVTTPAIVTNNLLVGTLGLPAAGAATLSHNYTSAQGNPLLVDQASYDYHLAAGSPCIDQGVDPGSFMSQGLSPTDEYVHPLATRARTVVGAAIDIGAFEYGLTTDAGSGGAGGGAGGGAAGGGAAGGSAGGGTGGGAAGGSAGGGSAGGSADVDGGTTGATASGCTCASPGGLGLLGLLAVASLRRRRGADIASSPRP